ncbi:uncharacterized protein [Diadema setosum]|uniref:uncharacterized protein n=1 Tax=Diadema setosum TaxID=31175 RepID=UPI003B3BD5AE
MDSLKNNKRTQLVIGTVDPRSKRSKGEMPSLNPSGGGDGRDVMWVGNHHHGIPNGEEEEEEDHNMLSSQEHIIPSSQVSMMSVDMVPDSQLSRHEEEVGEEAGEDDYDDDDEEEEEDEEEVAEEEAERYQSNELQVAGSGDSHDSQGIKVGQSDAVLACNHDDEEGEDGVSSTSKATSPL